MKTTRQRAHNAQDDELDGYSWDHPQLLKDKNGKILPFRENYRLIINHFFPGIRLSTFEQRIYLSDKPLVDDDYLKIDSALTRFLHSQGQMQDIKHAVRKIATEKGFSPLKDWFQALPSSHARHLDSWLIDVCGAADTAANRLIGRKWLISGAARALEPGCYVEGTMVLYGQSGVGKSRLVESLAPRPEWYCSSDIDMSNSQKASQTCQGKFMIELAELASVRRCDMEQLKAYLTTSNDTYVPKFANNPVTVPRCHVYAASTNDPGVLAEEAMSRRFWCVEVGRVDHARFMLIRSDLWAEARDAYLAGERWTLTLKELALVHESNTRFHDQDPLAEHLTEYLRNMNSGFLYGNEIPTRDLNIEAKKLDLKVHPRRVAKVMRELGWKDRKSNGNTVWCRPPDERKPPPAGCDDEPVPFQSTPNSAAPRPN